MPRNRKEQQKAGESHWAFRSSERRAPLTVRMISREITEDKSEVRESWNRVNLKRRVGGNGDMATPKESVNLTPSDLKHASRARLLTPECENCSRARPMKMLQNARFVSFFKEDCGLYTGKKYGVCGGVRGDTGGFSWVGISAFMRKPIKLFFVRIEVLNSYVSESADCPSWPMESIILTPYIRKESDI